MPAGTKIYTVSLGVQSDEVLLQDIATAKGGVFHAIHSPADIGKLHEIYIHLQALAGGEEVITAGSDSVGGIGIAAAMNGNAAHVEPGRERRLPPMPPPVPAPLDSQFFPELADLVVLDARVADDPAAALSSLNTHVVPVDDTVTSVVMMASWHNEKQPVSLSLLTPSLKTISLGSTLGLNRAGSSYQYFRIENPEPGLWIMRVEADRKHNDNVKGARAYSWGAYGTTPIGVRCKLPKKLLGVKQIKFSAQPVVGDKLVRTIQVAGNVNGPVISVDDLIKKVGSLLKNIKLPFEPDTTKLDPNLFKLGILDRQLQANGKSSVFSRKSRKVTLTRPNNYTGQADTSVPGIYTLQLTASGKTRKGFAYSRLSVCSVRV